MTTGFVADSLLIGHRVSRPSTERRALGREDRSLNRMASGDALPLAFPAFVARRRKLHCRVVASSVTPECALSLRRISPHQFLVMLGHCFGASRRPAARRRSASLAAPLWGLGSSQNKFVNAAENAAQTSSGPHQESTPWHLGAGPTRWLCQG
jgi:hypothetical protein